LIRAFSQNHPQAFGMLVTFLGVAFFFPDALVVKMIGSDVMTIAVWRGLAAAGATLAAVALFDRSLWPGWAALITPVALSMVVLQGFGSLFFMASLGATSAANALLILATSPFLAAIFSRIFLHEKVDRATGLAIVAVFGGVLVIGSGSIQGGGLLGDFFALINAVTVAAYYVILRHAKGLRLIVPIGLGYALTSALAFPFAPMTPLDGYQMALTVLSGGVIFPGGAALLQIGPRYLPTPEVSMISMLEIVVGLLLVWWVLGQNPGTAMLIGGTVINVAIMAHEAWPLRGLATARR
jgi:drug/metabolite transporter (DMT)-like permease